jgi:hypothetical protein
VIEEADSAHHLPMFMPILHLGPNYSTPATSSNRIPHIQPNPADRFCAIQPVVQKAMGCWPLRAGRVCHFLERLGWGGGFISS